MAICIVVVVVVVVVVEINDDDDDDDDDDDGERQTLGIMDGDDGAHASTTLTESRVLIDARKNIIMQTS